MLSDVAQLLSVHCEEIIERDASTNYGEKLAQGRWSKRPKQGQARTSGARTTRVSLELAEHQAALFHLFLKVTESEHVTIWIF